MTGIEVGKMSRAELVLLDLSRRLTVIADRAADAAQGFNGDDRAPVSGAQAQIAQLALNLQREATKRVSGR